LSNRVKHVFAGDIQEAERIYRDRGIERYTELRETAKHVTDEERALRLDEKNGLRSLIRKFTGSSRKRTGESVICDDGVRRDKPYDKMSPNELKRCKYEWEHVEELAGHQLNIVNGVLTTKLEQEARQLRLPFEEGYTPELERVDEL
jgi:hypothetical protein